MEQERFLAECRSLSLTARVALALLIFERFCSERLLRSAHVEEFLTHLWQWPQITGPDQFTPWEAARPALVNYGLGDELPEIVAQEIALAGVPEKQFRTLVSGVVEILWGSFWGAASDKLSFESLRTVVVQVESALLPSLTPFRCSRFSDRNGWGVMLSAEEYASWLAQRSIRPQASPPCAGE